jgi:predicted hydrocarbon binding protein
MPEERFIVNALVRQALFAAQDVMGENGLHAVLRAAGLEHFIDHMPPDDLQPAIKTEEYARFNQAIEEVYGRAGKGILQRVGRVSFQYALQEQPAYLGIAGAALQVLPQKQRIKFILNSMVSALKKTNPAVEAWAGVMDGKLVYIEKTCAICYGRTSDRPVCHLYIGSIGAAVKWATGRDYAVVETHCIAKGDPYCRFEIGEPQSQ